MADDDNTLVIHNLRTDDIMPEWHDSIDRAFERFDGRENIDRHILVAYVVGRVTEVVQLDAGPRVIVAVAPVLQILLCNVAISRILLQALESAVMLLIQSPVFVMRNPMQIKLLGNRVVCPNGSLQHRGVGYVESEVVLFEDLTGLFRLQDAQLREAHVLPAGKSVHKVEFGLSVPHETNLVLG